jgi:hypothetical protein
MNALTGNRTGRLIFCSVDRYALTGNIEKSEKHSGDVKVARTAADAAYKDIIARINAQIL